MMMLGLLVDGHAHATASVLPEAVACITDIVHQSHPNGACFCGPRRQKPGTHRNCTLRVHAHQPGAQERAPPRHASPSPEELFALGWPDGKKKPGKPGSLEAA
ncbi:hypothetical protein [Thauera linaloolentis]|uniref:hypothetical protein n=1 Tax=Thauera linaloolentis TaxID=76112 RepID=UPI0012B51D51|nr:hypothetical protein [Thauera linaloolentis]